MKKFWSTLISITMVMALLVGCGTSTESSDAAPSGGSSSTSESSGVRTVEEREDAPDGVSLTPESYTSEQLPGLENIGAKPLKKYKIDPVGKMMLTLFLHRVPPCTKREAGRRCLAHLQPAGKILGQPAEEPVPQRGPQGGIEDGGEDAGPEDRSVCHSSHELPVPPLAAAGRCFRAAAPPGEGSAWGRCSRRSIAAKG